MKTEESLAIIIKIVLSVLFLVCLLDMPYGYFQLVRFLALAGFAILANQANQKNDQTGTFVYIALAVLFQPLIKIPLGRGIWNIVDVIVAAGLIASIFMPGKNSGVEKHTLDKPYPSALFFVSDAFKIIVTWSGLMLITTG